MRKQPKPRDPFVRHLLVKKQGAHGKPHKSDRRQARVELAKNVRESER